MPHRSGSNSSLSSSLLPLSFPLPLLLLLLLLATSATPARSECLSSPSSSSPLPPEAEKTKPSSAQDFHVSFFKELVSQRPGENVVFSPFSVWRAFSLAFFGAVGETEEQLRRVLGLPSDKGAALRDMRELQHQYSTRKDTSVDNTFFSSNRLYFDRSVDVKECVEQMFADEISRLDFSGQATQAAQAINAFVHNATRGLITRLVTPSDLRDALLALVNAVYFKGTWTTPFDPKGTREALFHPFGKKPVNVQMMNNFNTFFNYSVNRAVGYSVLQMPYVGASLSMLVFLPTNDTSQSFSAMVDSLSAKTIEEDLRSARGSHISISFPKFKVESKFGTVELIRASQNVGLTNLFSSPNSDFSAFGLRPGLGFSSGAHKASLEVTEEGSEAAAATLLLVNRNTFTNDVICNRPFVYAIRDDVTSNIMFMGAFVNPESETGESAGRIRDGSDQ